MINYISIRFNKPSNEHLFNISFIKKEFRSEQAATHLLSGTHVLLYMKCATNQSNSAPQQSMLQRQIVHTCVYMSLTSSSLCCSMQNCPMFHGISYIFRTVMLRTTLHADIRSPHENLFAVVSIDSFLL